MSLKKIAFVFILIIFVSCKDLFFKKKSNPNQILTEEIDYNSIDAYPLLPECKSITDRTKQKECFYQKLTHRIKETLTHNLSDLTDNVQGDIMVIIKVSLIGEISVESIIISDEIVEKTPKLDGLIRESISQLPTLQPAIKLGIPVTTEFLLPITIN